MEKKKIIKNKQIIRGGIKTSQQHTKNIQFYGTQQIYNFFYIYKKLPFHYSPFCTRIKQKFYGEQFFQDHKTFHQLQIRLSPDNVNDFLRGFFIAEGDFDTRSNIKRGHFCQIVSRHLLSGCVKSGIVGDQCYHGIVGDQCYLLPDDSCSYYT